MQFLKVLLFSVVLLTGGLLSTTDNTKVQAASEIYEVSSYLTANGELKQVTQTHNPKYVSAALVKTELGFDLQIKDDKGAVLKISKEPLIITINKTEGMVKVGSKVLTFKNGIDYNHALRVGHINENKQFKSVPYSYDGHSLVIHTKKPTGLSLIPYVAPEFTDIASSKGKYDIERLYYFGIVNGVSNTSYAPASGITRGQIASMVARALELEPTSKNYVLTDIKDQWYADSVQALYQRGYIKGMGNNLFLGEEPVTKEQAAVIIANALTYYGKKVPVSALNNHEKLQDGTEVSKWAEISVDMLLHFKVLDVNEKFNPQQKATREEVAIMLYKTLQATGVYL